MNEVLREKAAEAGKPLMDYILGRIHDLELQKGTKRTILAACPNSLQVIRAALKSARRWEAPIKFAATLNQVDLDGGYTGLDQKEFVQAIREHAGILQVTSPVIVAIDHGGPWLKDVHAREKWTYSDTMEAVKKSFEAAIMAGYDLIHVDPTIDITLAKGSTVDIGIVVDRTLELIEHCEKFRRSQHYPLIAYEVGTEEVHGGLADLSVFSRFLELLRKGLNRRGLSAAWPCFVVGKVGTDLHTTVFDSQMAMDLAQIASAYGSSIKGHYTDNVSNPEDYPKSGMGAANIGPEFTEMEYEGLIDLEMTQDKLFREGKLAKPVKMKELLWKTVIASGRWRKWLREDENQDDFYANSPDRQTWLIKTGCRYIWENPEIVASRAKLYQNLALHGMDCAFLVESRIESAMDKYFSKFNLAGLNHLL
jgi:D-tagatose-1,6-bisphosphate aldolase subunit GatZ/KbaZ